MRKLCCFSVGYGAEGILHTCARVNVRVSVCVCVCMYVNISVSFCIFTRCLSVLLFIVISSAPGAVCGGSASAVRKS